jgi:hypothetical protein
MATEGRGAWAEVLGRIEAALERTLELAAEPAAPPQADPVPPLPPDERGEALAARLERAGADAAAADAALAAEADACRRWLDALAAARARLTDWAARPAP